MIVTAALYARVSTPNQEEEATIDSQVAAIERYMQDRGYDLTSEFYFLDKAVSGARLDRPALDRLRHLASDGAFAMVVCYSPDRLSRSYPHQWVIMDELQRNGVRVEFVNQPDLGENLANRFCFPFLDDPTTSACRLFWHVAVAIRGSIVHQLPCTNLIQASHS